MLSRSDVPIRFPWLSNRYTKKIGLFGVLIKVAVVLIVLRFHEVELSDSFGLIFSYLHLEKFVLR